MKNYGSVVHPKDVCTKEYADNLPTIRYEPQLLTEEQKSQARKNLGINGKEVTITLVKWGE